MVYIFNLYINYYMPHTAHLLNTCVLTLDITYADFSLTPVKIFISSHRFDLVKYNFEQWNNVSCFDGLPC